MCRKWPGLFPRNVLSLGQQCPGLARIGPGARRAWLGASLCVLDSVIEAVKCLSLRALALLGVDHTAGAHARQSETQCPRTDLWRGAASMHR